MWGEQWICKCGWQNFFMRTKCRNCGTSYKEATGYGFYGAEWDKESAEEALRKLREVHEKA